MISTSASRGLRRHASHAALLWLLGLYVLPCIHNVDHTADHSHRHRDEHEHEHEHERVPIDSDHGAGSVLHFASAVVDAQPFATLQANILVGVVPPQAPCHAPSKPKTLVFVRGPPPDA